jgi:SAM-dependent methyltransferase
MLQRDREETGAAATEREGNGTERMRTEDSDWARGFFTGAGLETVRDPERERTAPLEADWIARVIELRPGDRLLDVPCGNGRIAARLAEAGVRVTGIDRSPVMLREAKRRCRGLAAPPVFRPGDMRRLAEPPRYQAAINWWGSFGYFSDEENEATVAGLAAALQPGGRLLIDAPNREHVRRGALGWHEVVWGDVHIRHEVAWNAATERIEGEWLLVRRGRTRRLYSSIRLYTPSQMKALAERAGLVGVRLFGDWMGAPYQRGSLRCVLCARRPGPTGG